MYGYSWEKSKYITASWGSAFKIVDSVIIDGYTWYKLVLIKP